MDLSKGCTRLIISVCAANDLLRNQAAYVLATTRHETGGTMQPVRETFATSDKQAIARLDAAWAKGQLTWVTSPYWRKGWFGRGFAQITHEDNYDKLGRRIGIDLVSNPSKAMVPEIAAKIVVIGSKEGLYTGKKLADYITIQKSDFFNARAVINGDKNKKPKGQKVTNGELIAGYAREYDRLLRAEGYGGGSSSEIPNNSAPTKPVPTVPQPTTPQVLEPASSGLLAILIAFLKSVFGRKPS